MDHNNLCSPRSIPSHLNHRYILHLHLRAAHRRHIDSALPHRNHLQDWHHPRQPLLSAVDTRFGLVKFHRLTRGGVQFFMSHLPRWLRTRPFSEPTFRPSGTTKHWKNIVFCDFFLPVRAPASSFFWLFLFSDLLPSHILFSDSSHLCFSICPYCRTFDF